MCATCGCGHGHAHPVELITLEEKVLARNDEIAERNRKRLESLGVRAVNLMSSPGSGKTPLLERTINDLGGRRAVASCRSSPWRWAEECARPADAAIPTAMRS